MLFEGFWDFFSFSSSSLFFLRMKHVSWRDQWEDVITNNGLGFFFFFIPGIMLSWWVYEDCEQCILKKYNENSISLYAWVVRSSNNILDCQRDVVWISLRACFRTHFENVVPFFQKKHPIRFSISVNLSWNSFSVIPGRSQGKQKAIW